MIEYMTGFNFDEDFVGEEYGICTDEVTHWAHIPTLE